MSNWEKVKYGAFEWLKTLSSKSSFFSSKRLERFVFGGFYLLLCAAYVVYAFINKSFSALDVTLIGSPLLVAGGYNLMKSEQAKKKDNEGTSGEA